MGTNKTTVAVGCIFEYYGKIPENVYNTNEKLTLLEKAVYDNDPETIKKLVMNGRMVDAQLKIGRMSCIEYAAMMGYHKVLQQLFELSINGKILETYFRSNDIVQRSQLLSRNKDVFFDRGGLAEANRWLAALYTAIEYNQSECLLVLLDLLGSREIETAAFRSGSTTEAIRPIELAELRGF